MIDTLADKIGPTMAVLRQDIHQNIKVKINNSGKAGLSLYFFLEKKKKKKTSCTKYLE